MEFIFQYKNRAIDWKFKKSHLNFNLISHSTFECECLSWITNSSSSPFHFNWLLKLYFFFCSFGSFLVLVIIVMMNLLVGLAVSDIQGLQETATLDGLVRQSRRIARFESILFSSTFALLPLSVRNFLMTKVLLVPRKYHRVFTCRPNDPRDDRFPQDIKESLIKIVTKKKWSKKPKNYHGNHFSTTLQQPEIEEMLLEIQNRLVNQSSHLTTFSSSLEHRLLYLEEQWLSIHSNMQQLINTIKAEPEAVYRPNDSPIIEHTNQQQKSN